MRLRRTAQNGPRTAATATAAGTSTDGNGPARPEDERLPPKLLLVYGLQHILTMYAGAVAPALVIGAAAGLGAADLGVLVSGALLVAGLATLLQTLGVWRVGAQMPIVIGSSFIPVSAMTAVAADQGMPVVLGSSLVGGVFALLLTPFFGQLVRFFPPVVTGSLITVIGLSLMPVAAGWVVDGAEGGTPALGDLALAGTTLVLVLLFSRVLPGMFSRISILLGLVAGTLIAIPFGKADFGAATEGAVFSLGSPFHFGVPQFDWAACLTMCVIMLVVLTEGASHIIAVGQIIGTRVDAKRIAAGLRADVSASIIGPIFNTTPGSSFAQNIGLIALTKVRSRFVVATGAGLLVALGLFPILGRVVAAIPMPVLGGAGLVLFGTVAASGIRTLGTVDFDDNLNLILVATSLGFGVIPLAVPGFYESFPAWLALIMHSGIVGAAVAAIVLNICFNVIGAGRGTKGASVFAAVPTLDTAYPNGSDDSDTNGATPRGTDTAADGGAAMDNSAEVPPRDPSSAAGEDAADQR